MDQLRPTDVENLEDFSRRCKDATRAVQAGFYQKMCDTGFEPPFEVEFGPGQLSAAMPGRVKIGLGPHADPGSDIYWDLNYGIPLPDLSVSDIRSNQVLEHIQDIIVLFNDMWRILVPGGTMWHCVPHYRGPHSWGDPTHVRAFTETSFNYFCVDGIGKPIYPTSAGCGIMCAFVIDKIDVRPTLTYQ